MAAPTRSSAATRRKVPDDRGQAPGPGVPLRLVSSPPSRLDGGAGALTSSGYLGLRVLPPPALELGWGKVAGPHQGDDCGSTSRPIRRFSARHAWPTARAATVAQLHLCRALDRLRDCIVEAVNLCGQETPDAVTGGPGAGEWVSAASRVHDL